MTKFSSFSQRLCDDLSARKKSGWMEEISPSELKLMIFDNVYHQANICHKCSLLLLWIHKSKLPADTLTNTFPCWQPNQLFLLIEFLSEWKWAKFFIITLQPDNSNNSKKEKINPEMEFHCNHLFFAADSTITSLIHFAPFHGCFGNGVFDVLPSLGSSCCHCPD